MALKPCRECSKEISKQADACPHCGAPIKRTGGTSTFTWIMALILGGWLVSFIGGLSDSPGTRATTSQARATTTPRRPIRYAHTTINIRQGPGTQFERAGQLQRGDRVEIVETTDGWSQVSVNGNDQAGYVKDDLLEANPIPPLEIADWNWVSDPDFAGRGAIIWTVQVRNNTPLYIELAKVDFTSFDANGRLITTDHLYVRGLTPGGTASETSYATYFGTEKTATARVLYR